jgi:lipopolysaccharide transport protein LptA
MAGARLLGAATAFVLAVIVAAPALAQAQAQPQKQERKVRVEGAVAEIDDVAHTVVLSGGAKLTTTEGTMTSDEMRANLAKDNTIETAEATGEVRINFSYKTKDGVEREIQGAADRGTYTSADRTVRLIGHVTARLTEPATQRTIDLTADEVTFWIDESRLRIKPAELVFTEAVKQEQPPAAAAK